MRDEYYAHSREGKPREDWHRLDDHLKKVVDMVRSLTNSLNNGGFAYFWILILWTSKRISFPL